MDEIRYIFITQPSDYIKSLQDIYQIIKQNINLFSNDNFNEILVYLIRNYYAYKDDITFLNIIEIIISSEKLTSVSDITLITLCSSEPDLYNKFILKGISPSVGNLLIACEMVKEYNKITDLIRNILEHKIIPTHECFEKLLQNRNSPYSNNTINNILNYFIEFGLTLDLSDIKKLVSLHIEIDIKKFDITPDDELINLCFKNLYFPKYLDDVKITETQLHELFKYLTSLNIDDIKLFVEKHNLKCDFECLRNACTKDFSIKKDIIRYLINEQHVKPTKEILQLLYKQDNKFSLFSIIADNL
jgi:hypothetical protein